MLVRIFFFFGAHHGLHLADFAHLVAGRLETHTAWTRVKYPSVLLRTATHILPFRPENRFDFSSLRQEPIAGSANLGMTHRDKG